MRLSHAARFLAAALVLFAAPARANAQAEIKGSEADTAAIQQVFADFYGAFSRQDAHATAMTFTEDGDFTNMLGFHVHGRDAIEQRFATLFKGNLKGSSRTDTVRSVHFYAPTLAFVDADTVITAVKNADGSAGRVRQGLMIVVMVKENGRWHISNFHEAEYPERAPAPAPATK